MSAPVVLFAYNRSIHTQKTLAALANNVGAENTELYVFIDAAKNESDIPANNEVINIFQHVKGFKDIHVTIREKNYGLAKNIVSGVTQVINKHGQAIILEDDIVTSRHFLQYMNDALVTYKDSPDVGAVSGCNYPVELDNLETDTYFMRIPLCWGWATWRSRWRYFEKDISKLQFIDKKTIDHINFDGRYNYFKQATDNKNGTLNTWFIFWYISHVQHSLLTLFPKKSMVENIGHDGSGENCQEEQSFDLVMNNQRVDIKKQGVFESKYAVEQHKRYFESLKKPFLFRLFRAIKRFFASVS